MRPGAPSLKGVRSKRRFSHRPVGVERSGVTPRRGKRGFYLCGQGSQWREAGCSGVCAAAGLPAASRGSRETLKIRYHTGVTTPAKPLFSCRDSAFRDVFSQGWNRDAAALPPLTEDIPKGALADKRSMSLPAQRAAMNDRAPARPYPRASTLPRRSRKPRLPHSEV